MATSGATRKTIGIVVVLVIAYVGLAWAGFIPETYNVFQSVFDTDTQTTVLTEGELEIEELPETVNLTNDPSQTFSFNMTCTESYIKTIMVEIDVSEMVNSTAILSSANNAWLINNDKDTATYTSTYLIEDDEVNTLDIIFNKVSGTGAVGGYATITFSAEIGDIVPETMTIEVI